MNTFSGDNAYNDAEDYITNLARRTNEEHAHGGLDRIIVENQTEYDLEYVTNGHKVGWAYDDVKKGFVDRGNHVYVIPAKEVGTQLWRAHTGALLGKFLTNVITVGMAETCHTQSYFSVRIRTPGKNYIVCCGSYVGFSRDNKAGIQIRGEDGVLDGNGNITGHGVDATGNVNKIGDLTCAVHHSTRAAPGDHEGGYHQFSEVTRSFEVTCLFNNVAFGCHRFIFKMPNGNVEQ